MDGAWQLRHAGFSAERTDKAAGDVVREMP